MVRKSLIFISSIAAPHQIKLCNALQDYFDCEFWFYDRQGKRADFWKVPLGENCKVLNKVPIKWKSKFITFQHIRWLSKYSPDILMLGGFSVPANYLAYLWARFNKKKTIVFTERSRNRRGELRKRTFTWRLIRWLYRNVDLVMVSEKDIVPQFRDEFRFGNKVVAGRYAADIDNYLAHLMRYKKNYYTYLFPNRLVEIYNPIGTLEIFSEILKRYPGSYLLMNAMGPLRKTCEARIDELRMTDSIEFLDDIKSWDVLHEEYERADIMILPAKFSNGNFTIIEAMASGMGIIISKKVLGIGKMIENEVNGFNVKPETKSFVEAIERYIHDPTLFKEHGILNKHIVEPLGPKGTSFLYNSIISNL